MRAAVIGIGSNSVRMLVAEAADGEIRRISRDRAGTRLGYGGGCYDRYLPMLSPVCQIVGIAFDEQRVGHVPTDAHDLPLPNIVSA